jgi:hypothetical protein
MSVRGENESDLVEQAFDNGLVDQCDEADQAKHVQHRLRR